MKLEVGDVMRIGVAVCIVIGFCPVVLIACARPTLVERALLDATLLDASPGIRSSAVADAGVLHATDAEVRVDSGIDTKGDASESTSRLPECELDHECRIISNDVSDCSAERFVVSESDPRWARYLHDVVNTTCRICEGSLEALKGVCDGGKCRAMHFTLMELQACEADDDCVLGYSSPQFCYCSSSAPDPMLAYNKNLPGPGSETYNRCLVLCPAVACPVAQDAGPPMFEARCNASKRCEVAARP